MSGNLALTRSRAALFVVDIQERLLPAMPEDVASRVVRNTVVLIETAARLGLPIVVSQQYPKGLGGTIKPIEEALVAAASTPGFVLHRFDKTEFSAAASTEFFAFSHSLGRTRGEAQWIVTGMETHVCVYQTARDLVARGYQAHVVSDAVCSRTKANWKIGIDLIDRAGGIPTSTEVCVFDLLERAGSDEFKTLSRLIK